MSAMPTATSMAMSASQRERGSLTGQPAVVVVVVLRVWPGAPLPSGPLPDDAPPPWAWPCPCPCPWPGPDAGTVVVVVGDVVVVEPPVGVVVVVVVDGFDPCPGLL